MVLFAASVTPLFLTAVLLLVPGLLVGLAAGLGRVLAVTAAPAVTFGLVMLLGRLTTATGLPWNPVSLCVFTSPNTLSQSPPARKLAVVAPLCP